VNRECRPGVGISTEATSRPDKATARVSLTVPDIHPEADKVAAALAYAEAGIYVLPVKHPTKHPGSVVGEGWQHKSSRDPRQIVAWFAGTNHDIALHCGRSGLVVFDVDYPDKVPAVLARHLRSAPYQSTRPEDTGRGHYVFAMPPGRRLGNGGGGLGGEWGEVRGLNGVIIVAPSRHADGGEYLWIRTGPVPVLPEEIAELLDDASPASDAANDVQVAAFLAEHTEATRPRIMAGWAKALQTKFETGSRHTGAVSVTVGALKEARAGYFSAQAVVDILGSLFVAAATRGPTGGEKQRNEKGALAEYASIVAWAVSQANAADLDEVRKRTEEKMPEVTHAGHLGYAIKMAKQFEGKLLYVNRIGWHRWDGKRYVFDGNGAARRAVHTVLKRERKKCEKLPLEEREKRAKQIARYETAPAITGILTEAAALEVFSVEVSDLDSDAYLFNCANGTYDLRTDVLRTHDPADRITKVANAAFNANAVGVKFHSFLTRVLPDEQVRGYQQRLFGLSLLGEVNGDKQILPIMIGGGANGKTTLIEAVSHAMGDYATTAEPTLLMEKRSDAHPTGVADLRGRRFVSVSETEQRRRFDIALVKRLTGGDSLKARLMRQDFFTFVPTYLLVLATNHLPRIDDDTEAVWRRIRVIPFTVQIPEAERDTHLNESLRAEADAVLTWNINGWKDYREDGLREPNQVLLATNAYKADSDAIGRFIEDECDTGGAQSAATTQALYDEWLSWAERDGCPALSRIAFGRALDAKGYIADKKTHDRLRRGISLKSKVAQVND
jgi:putative DNA primase/helicase